MANNQRLRTELSALKVNQHDIVAKVVNTEDAVRSIEKSIQELRSLAAKTQDDKLSQMNDEIKRFSKLVGQLRFDVESADATGRLAKMEAQIQTFRTMFGLGPPQQPLSPPVGFPEDPRGKSPQAAENHNVPPPFQSQNVRSESIPDPYDHLPFDQQAVARASDVKQEFQSSWQAYKKYAWGHDELCPNSRRHKDWGGRKSNGIGLTAVDSLSTLFIMGLHDEFSDAVKLVTEYVDFDQDIHVSVFESTIRVVGGLLSAFELSGEQDRSLLETARLVMDKLLVAFNTTTGIPHQTVNLRTKVHWNPDWTGGASILSEFGSIQLELRTLSYHTKNPLYDMIATHLAQILDARCVKANFLCPTMFSVSNAEARSEQITLGALGDSYYEYLLKQYLLTGKTEMKYRQRSTRALDEIIHRMLQYSHPSRQAYVAEMINGVLDHKMDHLACFSGGMFALASRIDSDRSSTYLKVASDLTATCFQMYDQSPTGLSPEIVEFSGGGDFYPAENYFLLRPETVESIFYLWRLTKKHEYRTMQWKIYSHLKRFCKSKETGGYSGIQMVTVNPPEQDDLMQSFWLAETMKYIYLTFVEDSVVDLDHWVFNTEAHPFKIRPRDPLDIWRDWERDDPQGKMPWYPPTIAGVEDVETEKMKRLRLSSGNRPVVAPVDPNGMDMKPVEAQDVDGESQPYNPQEDIFSKVPLRRFVANTSRPL
jgi:mannosyl-oligosaccharide alpha-1,2-mannosidase